MKFFIVMIALVSSFASAQNIRVGIDDFPPYSRVHQDGTFSGLNVDVVTAVSKKLGITVNFVHCPWVRCLKLLDKGDIDLMSGVLLTQERAERYQFVYPPYESVQSNSVYFYQLASTPAIVEEQDLLNKIIAVQRGVVYTPEFDNNERIIKVEINDQAAIIKMLLKGNIDAFIYAGVAADSLIKKHDLLHQIIRSPLSFKSKRDTHLVLSKQGAFADRANDFGNALSQLLDDGVITNIFRQYGIEHGMPEDIEVNVK